MAVIDVANQGDWANADQDFSTKDIAAADGKNLVALLTDAGAGDNAALLAEITQGIARRLEGHQDAWEAIDTDRDWWYHNGDTAVTALVVASL